MEIANRMDTILRITGQKFHDRIPPFFPYYKDEEPYTKDLASDMVNDTPSQAPYPRNT